MIEPSPNHPVQPGEPAPSFELPAITRDGVIRLVDFRGNHPVLLGLFRGLHCAFCRRHIAALGALDVAGAQLIGAFLVDRAGIVRWTLIKAAEGRSGLGRFPKTEEFLTAAPTLAM